MELGLEVGQLKAAGALRVAAELQGGHVEAAVVQEAPEADDAPAAELFGVLRRPVAAEGLQAAALAPAAGARPGAGAGATAPGLRPIQVLLQGLAQCVRA